MVVKKLLLRDDDLRQLTRFLFTKYKFDYQLITDASATLAFEEHYYRNSSMQMNMVVLQKTTDGIRVDAIGGGGGSGIFGFSLGSEKEFVNVFFGRMKFWAEKKNLVVEEIETIKI